MRSRIACSLAAVAVVVVTASCESSEPNAAATDDGFASVGEAFGVSEECEANVCTAADPCTARKQTTYKCVHGTCLCTSAGAQTCGDLGVCNAPACSDVCSASSSCASNNFCESAGVVTTCDNYGVCDRGNCEAFCGGGPPLYAIRQCSDTCVAGGGVSTTCGAMGYSCTGALQTGGSSPPCSTCSGSSAPTQQCVEGAANSTCGAHHVYAPVPGKGMQDILGGADSNRCVNDPVSQVATLNADGGAIFAGFPTDFPDPSDCDRHWQTIQRLPNDPSGFVTSISWYPNQAGYLFTGNTSTGYMADAVFNSAKSVGDDQYNHAGGGQMLGDYFFVGLEKNEDPKPAGAVGVWRATSTSLDETGGNVWLLMPPGVQGAGEVGAVKLQPFPGEVGSRYMVVVGGPADTDNLYFFVSDPGVSLDDGASGFHYTGMLGLRAGGSWQAGWNDYQNINIVTDCASGALYLVTLSRDGASGCSPTGYGGDDYVKIFKLDVHFDPSISLLSFFSIGAGPVTQRHMVCHDTCNLDAGAGVYVGPGGSLNVYATEHDNDGPAGSVKMREFAQP